MILRRAALPKIAKIDMTPMAGVLICLLIIFIVITPMYGGYYTVQLPSVSNLGKDIKEDEMRAIVGLYEERVFFRGRRLEGGLVELQELLRNFIAENPSVPPVVYLKADIEQRYSRVSQAMSACRSAGATDVRLVAEPRFEEPLPWPFDGTDS